MAVVGSVFVIRSISLCPQAKEFFTSKQNMLYILWDLTANYYYGVLAVGCLGWCITRGGSAPVFWDTATSSGKNLPGPWVSPAQSTTTRLKTSNGNRRRKRNANNGWGWRQVLGGPRGQPRHRWRHNSLTSTMLSILTLVLHNDAPSPATNYSHKSTPKK